MDVRAGIGRAARITLRLFLYTLSLIGVAALVALVLGWRAFGHRPEGQRKQRAERSPQWRDGQFVNPQPIINDWTGVVSGLLHTSPHTTPLSEPPTVTIDPQRFATLPLSGLRVTWLGHSSILVEVDGHRVLTDPVFSPRVTPISFVGPQRYYAPLIELGKLPGLDAVVISHDHYDHLDYRTIRAMKDWNTTFIVPLGVGAHLAYWGVPESRIVELDWWESHKVRDLEIVCTPARHASGRTQILDRDRTLWAGYALIGKQHRAFYSGDTGLFPAMKDIGTRLGPFDVTMIETGQYHRAWPDWHIGPEQAVIAHKMLRGRVMLPVHWALFTLAYHGWTEPAERVLTAAASSSVTLVMPKPGESIEPAALPTLSRWWPTLSWESAAQSPIVSSQMGDAVGAVTGGRDG